MLTLYDSSCVRMDVCTHLYNEYFLLAKNHKIRETSLRTHKNHIKSASKKIVTEYLGTDKRIGLKREVIF